MQNVKTKEAKEKLRAIRPGRADRVFDVINVIVLGIALLITAYYVRAEQSYGNAHLLAALVYALKHIVHNGLDLGIEPIADMSH